MTRSRVDAGGLERKRRRGRRDGGRKGFEEGGLCGLVWEWVDARMKKKQSTHRLFYLPSRVFRFSFEQKQQILIWTEEN